MTIILPNYDHSHIHVWHSELDVACLKEHSNVFFFVKIFTNVTYISYKEMKAWHFNIKNNTPRLVCLKS